MNRRYSSKVNGKKGGRPTYEKVKNMTFKDVELIILTPNQYGTLLEKYGYKLLMQALMILENWFRTSPEGEKYIGKNNYAHFRSDGWVINEAKHSL